MADLRSKTRVAVEGLPASRESYERSISQVQILINASPIGMSPRTEESPVPSELLDPRLTVFDIVYNPLKTRLLREAESKGCRTVPGVEMFVWQAAAQFELWTGRMPNMQLAREIIIPELTMRAKQQS